MVTSISLNKSNEEEEEETQRPAKMFLNYGLRQHFYVCSTQQNRPSTVVISNSAPFEPRSVRNAMRLKIREARLTAQTPRRDVTLH
jgi:Fic family protein